MFEEREPPNFFCWPVGNGLLVGGGPHMNMVAKAWASVRANRTSPGEQASVSSREMHASRSLRFLHILLK